MQRRKFQANDPYRTHPRFHRLILVLLVTSDQCVAPFFKQDVEEFLSLSQAETAMLAICITQSVAPARA